jgi:hypothetical protein
MDISDCINKQDKERLLKLLKSKVSPFQSITDKYIDWYMAQLTQEKESKLVNINFFSLFLIIICHLI